MKAGDAMKQAIDALTKKGQRFIITTGKVTSATYKTCTVEREGLPTLTDVRLNAIDAEIDNKVTIHPQVGSYVQVAMIEGTNEGFLVATSEIGMVEVLFEDTSVEITNEGIVIDGGENGGMVISPKLVQELEILKSRVNGILAAIRNAKPGVQDGGLALHTSMVLDLTELVTDADFSDIENPKVTH